MEKKDGFFASLKEKRILTVTGCWVFYFLMALIPLVFLLITAFGFFGVDLSLELAGRLPAEFRDAVEIVVGTASNVSKSVTVFFIITVLISCSTLLGQMSKDGEYIYGAKGRAKRGIFRRLWALVLLSILFLLFIAFALCFSFRNTLLLKFGEDRRNLLTVVSFVVIILFAYSIIALLNRFISPVKVRAFPLLFGSFISLCIMVLGSILLILYIRFFTGFNAFYGSLAGIVVFFLWAFILMLSLSFGSFVCMRIWQKNGEKEIKKE